jgi:hypothetical protein
MANRHCVRRSGISAAGMRAVLTSTLLTCIGSLAVSGSLAAAATEDVAATAATDIVPSPGMAAAGVLSAVWKPQNFDFHYQSFTTFYSCSSLQEKVRRILIALGGDKDTKVRVSGCETGSGIARMPLVRVTMTSPVEATPEALADLQKTRPVRELAARVRKDPKSAGSTPTELDAQFPAYWQRVSLSRGAFGLAPGDCELVEQIERKVLPKLAVRVVSSDMRCTPNQLTLGQPKLEVEALSDLARRDLVAADKKKRDGA